MKGKKFSFSRLLRNDRLMIIFSIVCAVTLWCFVLSGSTNVTTRTITCQVTTSNVKNGNLQVIVNQANQSIAVEVKVQGPWSVVSNLTSDDIRVQLNSSDIQSAGDNRIHVLASRNSNVNDYEIVEVTPAEVVQFCDEWSSGRVFSVAAGTVTTEAPLIRAGGDNCDIGDITIDESALPGGTLVVQGPSTVVSRIARLNVRVAEEATITDMQTFSGDISAVDSAGEAVKLDDCVLLRYETDPAIDSNAQLVNMTESKLGVTVAVNERRTINFTYEMRNAPSGIDLSRIVTLSTPSVVLEGEKNLLEQYADDLSVLTVVDFDQLTTKERARTINVSLPDGITVVGTGADELNVVMRFDWTGYASKTLIWEVGENLTDSPITFLNTPEGKNIRMLTDSFSVNVFGKRDAIAALKASDLRATVNMSNSSLGTYAVRPTVDNGDVWVYYGDGGYTLYLSIE